MLISSIPMSMFFFYTDISITTTNTYIEQECVTTNKDQNRFTVSDCNAKYLYGCKNTSSSKLFLYTTRTCHASIGTVTLEKSTIR